MLRETCPTEGAFDTNGTLSDLLGATGAIPFVRAPRYSSGYDQGWDFHASFGSRRSSVDEKIWRTSPSIRQFLETEVADALKRSAVRPGARWRTTSGRAPLSFGRPALNRRSELQTTATGCFRSTFTSLRKQATRRTPAVLSLSNPNCESPVAIWTGCASTLQKSLRAKCWSSSPSPPVPARVRTRVTRVENILRLTRRESPELTWLSGAKTPAQSPKARSASNKRGCQRRSTSRSNPGGS